MKLLWLGWLIFFAVFLHKIPEGFTVSSVMLASGRSRYGVTACKGGCLREHGSSPEIALPGRHPRWLVASYTVRKNKQYSESFIWMEWNDWESTGEASSVKVVFSAPAG